jgi:class 3 adenylate cyclase
MRGPWRGVISPDMRDNTTLLSALRDAADPASAAAIEKMIAEGSDASLCRVNVMDFAKRAGVSDDQAIAAFLHASRLGIFEMQWNVLCPGCGGVLDSNTTLKTVQANEYHCQLCAAGYEPSLDEMVEVTFTVDPRIRRIAAHDPDTLPPHEYYRQLFWGSWADLPDKIEDALDSIELDAIELPPGEKASLSLQLPPRFCIVFEPVSHAAQFIDVKGEPTKERRNLTLIFNKLNMPHTLLEMQPGPFRLAMENKTDRRLLPGIWVADDELHHLMAKRKPFLTAKRLLTNQTFRDLYRTDALESDQRLKITSLTFLFTDLKGSTALYDRVGDLKAYDLVRAHFDLLHKIVAAEAGAVVKTIGDAVMATFETSDHAIKAALKMRDAIGQVGAEGKAKGQGEDLLLKIGIHEGPCLAVMLNDRQDYFGQTVNIAARVQGLADSRAILATGAVVEKAETTKLLQESGVTPVAQRQALRGVTSELTLYELP